MLRHERMTVAMALAEFSHHSPRGQRVARAGVWGHEQNYTANVRKPPTPQPELFSLFVCPFVQILDPPVPQTGDNVVDALRILERPMAVQVIEVPKILVDVTPARSFVPEPQTAEQLVEVPTVLSPTRIALQIAEQIVDTPVRQGRGGKRRVQSFLPEQSSTATSSFLTVEQIVDIPSSVGEDFTGFFALFPWKKVRSAGQVVSAQLGEHVSSSTLSAHKMARAGEPVDSDGSDEWVLMRPPRHWQVLLLEQAYSFILLRQSSVAWVAISHILV